MSDICSTLLASPFLSAEQAGSLNKGKTFRHNPAKIPCRCNNEERSPLSRGDVRLLEDRGVKEEVISKQSE